MAFDILGAAGSAFGALDINGKLIDVAAGALGLPPEVTNIAKVGIGIATGNPITAASGAIGLAGNVLDNAAETEFSPSKSDPSAGYGGTCGNEPPKGSLNLNGPNGIMGGLFSIFQGTNEIDRTIAEKVGELLLDGKHEQGFKNLNNMVHSQNSSIAAAILGVPHCHAMFEKEFACKVDPSKIENGVIPFSADYSGDWSNPNSPLDPNILKYRESIDVLRANWATFDSASTGRDGFVQRADIEAIASNPNASEMMRNAAQFLIDNPEYFNRLEMAAGVGGKDGTIGFIDLTAEVKRINADIKEFGVPETRATGKSVYEDQAAPIAGGDSKLSGILNDPSMTLEEKLNALMDKITDDIDSELGETMKELDAAYSKDTKTDGKEDASKAQKKQGAIDKITRKLQQLMERRKQMTELATNMSKSFNDMAMAAIRNMK